MRFEDSRHPRARAGGGMLGALGITGGLICTATMVLPALGAAGAAAGGTQGMTGADEPPRYGLVGTLTDVGPAILVVSTLLVTLGVGLRRPLAAVPALAAGAVLYWGMYAQPSYPVMYLTLALGFTGWLATYLWARGHGPPRPDPTHSTRGPGRRRLLTDQQTAAPVTGSPRDTRGPRDVPLGSKAVICTSCRGDRAVPSAVEVGPPGWRQGVAGPRERAHLGTKLVRRSGEGARETHA